MHTGLKALGDNERNSKLRTVEKVTIELDRIDLGVVALLLARLPTQANNVERDGHLNAARYMRTAVHLCEQIMKGCQ